MGLDAAQLSALSTALDDLTTHITGLADGYQGSPREDVAADLFAVERNLRAARRRLSALLPRISCRRPLPSNALLPHSTGQDLAGAGSTGGREAHDVTRLAAHTEGPHGG